MVNYILEDNQGSGSTLTNSSGALQVRESFDAYGMPRDGTDWDGTPSSGDRTTIEGISRRGYTGHSMLGRMGLIHMNGRVQDSVTGRFLAADPYVSNPGFTQSYNRYAYVNNNPLSYIDPSGFCPPEDQVTVCDGELSEVLVTATRIRHYCENKDFSWEMQSACLGAAIYLNGLSESQRLCLVFGFCPKNTSDVPQQRQWDGGGGGGGAPLAPAAPAAPAAAVAPQSQKPQTCPTEDRRSWRPGYWARVAEDARAPAQAAGEALSRAATTIAVAAASGKSSSALWGTPEATLARTWFSGAESIMTDIGRMGSVARTAAAVGTRALAGLAVGAAWTVGTYAGGMIREATYWPGRKTVGDAINSYLLVGADLSITAAPETRCGW